MPIYISHVQSIHKSGEYHLRDTSELGTPLNHTLSSTPSDRDPSGRYQPRAIPRRDLDYTAVFEPFPSTKNIFPFSSTKRLLPTSKSRHVLPANARLKRPPFYGVGLSDCRVISTFSPPSGKAATTAAAKGETTGMQLCSSHYKGVRDSPGALVCRSPTTKPNANLRPPEGAPTTTRACQLCTVDIHMYTIYI